MVFFQPDSRPVWVVNFKMEQQTDVIQRNIFDIHCPVADFRSFISENIHNGAAATDREHQQNRKKRREVRVHHD